MAQPTIDGYDFTQLADIERYCIDRCDEIIAINKQFPCPSSVGCIAAFVGFVSNLYCGKDYWDNTQHSDSKKYVKFLNDYLPKANGNRYAQKGTPLQLSLKNGKGTKEVGEAIYHTLRCGALHSMSFVPRPQDLWKKGTSTQVSDYLNDKVSLPGNYVNIAVTHDDPTSLPNSNNGYYVINANDFCNDIRKAVFQMFQDAKLQQNILDVVKLQRPIGGIITPCNPTGGGQGLPSNPSTNSTGTSTP